MYGNVYIYIPDAPCMVYLPTFTIKIHHSSRKIWYTNPMDAMGYMTHSRGTLGGNDSKFGAMGLTKWEAIGKKQGEDVRFLEGITAGLWEIGNVAVKCNPPGFPTNSVRTPPKKLAWRAPKWWALEKVTPALNMTILGINSLNYWGVRALIPKKIRMSTAAFGVVKEVP